MSILTYKLELEVRTQFLWVGDLWGFDYGVSWCIVHVLLAIFTISRLLAVIIFSILWRCRITRLGTVHIHRATPATWAHVWAGSVSLSTRIIARATHLLLRNILRQVHHTTTSETAARLTRVAARIVGGWRGSLGRRHSRRLLIHVLHDVLEIICCRSVRRGGYWATWNLQIF